MDEHAFPRFAVVGEIDMATADRFRELLEHHVASSDGDVLLDCHELTFIDSCGIKVLIDVAAAASSQGRRVVTTNLQPQCRRTFEATGVEGLLGVT